MARGYSVALDWYTLSSAVVGLTDTGGRMACDGLENNNLTVIIMYTPHTHMLIKMPASSKRCLPSGKRRKAFGFNYHQHRTDIKKPQWSCDTPASQFHVQRERIVRYYVCTFCVHEQRQCRFCDEWMRSARTSRASVFVWPNIHTHINTWPRSRRVSRGKLVIVGSWECCSVHVYNPDTESMRKFEEFCVPFLLHISGVYNVFDSRLEYSEHFIIDRTSSSSAAAVAASLSF